MAKQYDPPPTTSDILEELEATRASMGKGAQRLADYILQQPEEVPLLSGSEIAKRCGVHASSVVRLAQGLGLTGYREMQSVFQNRLSASIEEIRRKAPTRVVLGPAQDSRVIQLIGESGPSFNEAAMAAAAAYCARNPSVDVQSDLRLPQTVDPLELALRIEQSSAECDGIILVAREHPAISNAVRAVTRRNVPVVCLTTDLPASGRTAYVGADQYSSGATAGWFCGRMHPQGTPGQVLFICSVPFRCHQDREQGFRQSLRSEFPQLAISEKVSSDESIEVTYEALRRYIGKNGPPSAVYNVSGGNLGVGRALKDEGLSGATIFIGHELNANSRALLERGMMDVAIGHDFDHEIDLAVDCILAARLGVQPVNRFTQSQLFTKYNCAVL